MTSFPDFTAHGYQIIEQLGRNPQGGRVTYKAIESNTQEFVVIKQFKFITSQDWDGYKAVEREINVLKGLNHSGIPHYLTSFDPSDGLCLVQEYINAQPLSVPRSFTPEEVKEIAIQLLEILIYLQNRIPPIIHRDIKPENVLIDEQLKIYLVDFGCARIGHGEVTALSSMVVGTTGFMPPEQLLNRPLTEASDLYGLGATLICLLTQTKSIELNSLVDHNFRINFKSLLPKLNIRFIEWLEKMVQPDINQRFRNAKEALNNLTLLDLIRIPKVKFSQTELRFYANQLNEKITQTIIITNSIPETVLEGKWSVKPHPKDPPLTPDSHAWITFRPQQFQGNQVECEVIVDTSQLMDSKIYEREIILNSNAIPQNHLLNVKVQSAPSQIKIARKNPPYLSLTGTFCLYGIIGFTLGSINIHTMISTNVIEIIIVGTFLAAFGSTIKYANEDDSINSADVVKLLSVIVFAITMAIMKISDGVDMAILGAIIGGFLGVIVAPIVSIFLLVVSTMIKGIIWLIFGEVINQFKAKKYKERNAYLYIFLTVILGITTGIGTAIGWSNPYILPLLIATGLPLSAMLIYPPLQQARLKAQYRKREKQHLIEP